MTTITLQENTNLSKTSFINMVDLYNYMIDNQLITEIWYLNTDDLSQVSKELLIKSKKSSNLINI